MGKLKNESAVLFQKFQGEMLHGKLVVEEGIVSKWIAQKDHGCSWFSTAYDGSAESSVAI